MSLKIHNITEWNERGLNYWGIPKCGNTSFKYALMGKKVPPLTQPFQSNDWIHREDRATYITPEHALNNGNWNFTIIRDPISRVVSLYNDFFIKRRDRWRGDNNIKTFDQFVDFLAQTPDNKHTDLHFRSQMSFLIPAIAKNKLFIGKLEHLNVALEVINQYNTGDKLIVPTTHTTGYPLNVTNDCKNKILQRYHEDYCLYNLNRKNYHNESNI